jgi:hypothetical protein
MAEYEGTGATQEASQSTTVPPASAPPAEAPTPPGTPPAPAGGIPQGDPLEPWRDVFTQDPQLLATFTQHFGSEHGAGAALSDAHTFADQALTETERRLLIQRGLGNDPATIQALGRLGKEYAGMRQTIDDLTRENARLKAQAAGKPQIHLVSTDNAMILGGGVDLHAEEVRLVRAIQAVGNDLDRRRELQAKLSAVQETLYRK